MKRVLSIGVLLCVFGFTSAQYMVEIKPTKKVVHVDQLGLADNTCVMDVLNTMPELLDRSSYDYFTNFSIQVDDKDVGASRDVVLNQTKLAEVDVIEISTSPTVSEQKNGDGGVINIKLKPVTREGVSGEVMVSGSTEWDVQPSLLLNYKKKNFTLRSSLMMEYWAPTDYKEKYRTDTNLNYTRLDTIKTRFCQETAKLHLQWNPTTQDEVKVYLWETYNRSKVTAEAGEEVLTRIDDDKKRILWKEVDMHESMTQKQWKLVAEGRFTYKHLYTRGGEFQIESSYSYNPTDDDYYWKRSRVDSRDIIYDMPDSLIQERKFDHQVMGEISSKHLLLPASHPHYLDLKGGVNTTYSFGNSRVIQDVKYQHTIADTAKTKGNKLYVSPYLELNYHYKGWELQVGARYQYYRNALEERNMDMYYTHNHTWLGNASVIWRVKEHHLLRLMLSRDVSWSMVRNNENKVTPEASPYYTGDLNYVFDWNDSINYVMTSFGIRYLYANRDNGDISVLSANAQLIFRHGIFSMAFAGNVYAKDETYYDKNHKNNWRFHANLSLTPVLAFRKNWTLSAKFIYNSQMFLRGTTYGDCFCAKMRVSKTWNKWNVYAEMVDIFDYTTYNTYKTDWGTVKELEDMYPRCFALGASYKF